MGRDCGQVATYGPTFGMWEFRQQAIHWEAARPTMSSLTLSGDARPVTGRGITAAHITDQFKILILK